MPIIHAGQALTENGWQNDIAIEVDHTGRIAGITAAQGPADHVVDLILPAPVNLHSHSFQRAMSGLTEARGPNANDSFWTWRSLMYRFLDRLTPEMIEAIAELAFMEMAEAGFGCVTEFHYLHHDVEGRHYSDVAEMGARIIRAAAKTGLGLTMLPVHYQFGGCDMRALQGGQRRFGTNPDQFNDLWQATEAHMHTLPPDANLGWAPHSLRAVAADQLGTMAGSIGRGGPVHIHAAEQTAEVDEVMSYLGARPVAWLTDALGIDHHWCLIHATQMTSHETTALARSGAVAGLCPITESSLGDGIFNGAEYAKAGGLFGIGSDSDIQISLFAELRTLEYSQRLRDRGRAILASASKSTGRTMFDAVCEGGARAAGRASGAIAPGAWADLIGISTDNHILGGCHGDVALDALVFSGKGSGLISDLWSAGRHIVQDGKHVDRTRIIRQYRQVQSQLEDSI